MLVVTMPLITPLMAGFCGDGELGLACSSRGFFVLVSFSVTWLWARPTARANSLAAG